MVVPCGTFCFLPCSNMKSKFEYKTNDVLLVKLNLQVHKLVNYDRLVELFPDTPEPGPEEMWHLAAQETRYLAEDGSTCVEYRLVPRDDVKYPELVYDFTAVRAVSCSWAEFKKPASINAFVREHRRKSKGNTQSIVPEQKTLVHAKHANQNHAKDAIQWQSPQRIKIAGCTENPSGAKDKKRYEITSRITKITNIYRFKDSATCGVQ